MFLLDTFLRSEDFLKISDSLKFWKHLRDSLKHFIITVAYLTLKLISVLLRPSMWLFS